jgi:predicted ATP-grasp superfamily ATP-dependent carboligase
MRFDPAEFHGLLQNDETIHDIPRAGTIIGRGEPLFTLISKIAPNSTHPMRRHRVLMRQVHAAAKHWSVEGYSSPRSSA